MKVALLLTGQLQTVDMVKYAHMNTIITKYDTDVVLSINIDNRFQTEYKNSREVTATERVTELINFFNPVYYSITNDYTPEFNNLINII
jgi:hypothetical protein